MSDLEQKELMMVASVKWFPWKTSEYYKDNMDWLKTISIFWVEFYLSEWLKKWWITDNVWDDWKIIYYATEKWYNKYLKDVYNA